MDALDLAARTEAGLQKVVPPPSAPRVWFYAVPDPEGGPWTISRLRQTAAEVGVTLFRDKRGNGRNPRRFYAVEPVDPALMPWTGSDARAAEEQWLNRRTASHLLLMAAANSEIRGRGGGRAIALPDPAKDPDGFVAGRTRLAALSLSDRFETALETRRVVRLLPEGRTGGLRRTLEVLQQVSSRSIRPQERPEGR